MQKCRFCGNKVKSLNRYGCCAECTKRFKNESKEVLIDIITIKKTNIDLDTDQITYHTRFPKRDD